jgi:hypothetical protein
MNEHGGERTQLFIAGDHSPFKLGC